MRRNISKADAQLLAALLYRDAVYYIEQHQPEYMHWQQTRKLNDTVDNSSRKKEGEINETDWIPQG